MFTDFEHPDRVEGFFEGKTVLITGGTGFLGKVLIEKLLRACPKVKQVITLVKTKREKGPHERMKEILQGSLFDSVREKYGPAQIDKVKACRGDLTKEGLHLHEDDKLRFCEEVQIVFHCAATIRFDMPLKTAVQINVEGTKRMLDLAKEMRNLQVFQYISTAYCHLEEAELFEKAYAPPSNPHHILKICEWLTEEDVEVMTPRLLGNSPNTYAFTKALAEALVVEEMKNLPALIVRPSVLIPIWEDPIPGWTDNLNGIAGLLIGAGKGVIRTMYLKKNSYSDFIPVDVVVNALLLISFYHASNPEKRVFHLTTSEEVKVPYDEILETGRKVVLTKVPLPGVAWYPGGSPKSSKLYNKLCSFFYHWIPAILVDTILYLLGYEPVLMRVQRRVAKGCQVLEYYASNEWTYNNREVLELRKGMNPSEKKKYRLDCDGFDLEEYLESCVLSVRRYMLNEPDDTIPASRRHMLVLWIVDRTCKILWICAFLYLVHKHLYLRFFS